MKSSSQSRNRITEIGIGAVVLAALYLTSRHSYLLFHSLSEVFSIVVAWSIFMLVWNARRFLDNGYFLLIGIAFFPIGIIDLLHILAYAGYLVEKPRPAIALSERLRVLSRRPLALYFDTAPDSQYNISVRSSMQSIDSDWRTSEFTWLPFDLSRERPPTKTASDIKCAAMPLWVSALAGHQLSSQTANAYQEFDQVTVSVGAQRRCALPGHPQGVPLLEY